MDFDNDEKREAFKARRHVQVFQPLTCDHDLITIKAKNA